MRLEPRDSESTQAFRTLAENSPDIIVRFDGECRQLYDNPVALRLLGVSTDKAIGKTLREIGVPEPYCGLWDERIRTVFATAQSCDVADEFQVGKRLLCFESRCVPEFGLDGRVRSVLVLSRNTSEHHRKELESQFSRGILSSMGSAVLISAPDGCLVYANDACCRLLGFTREELLELTVFDLEPDYPREKWRDYWEGVKQESLRTIEARSRTKSGRFLPIEFLVNHIVIGGNEYHCVILTDISARKQVEQALHESEQLRDLALNASDTATWTWDVATGQTFWDERYYEQYGLDPLEAPNHDAWLACLHPEDRQRLQARIAALTVPGGSDRWNERFRSLHPVRGERWMHGLGKVERDAHGKAIRFAGINRDITAQKRVQEALTRSEENFRAMFNGSHEAIMLLDNAGVVLCANDAMCERMDRL